MMTHKQRICLTFLRNKMTADSASIGADIAERTHKAKSSKISMIGSSTANSLAKNGFVGSHGTPKAWFITQKGRDAIAKIGD